MELENRIEALEQQVASRSSALFTAEDILGYRVYLLEEKLKGQRDETDHVTVFALSAKDANLQPIFAGSLKGDELSKEDE